MKLTKLSLYGVALLLHVSCTKEASEKAVTDGNGNSYETVTIGTQVWMAENLNTTKYNDGTDIPNVSDSIAWGKLTTAAYCNYKNDEKYAEKYGRLYNWYAVNSGKLAPKGWHVPTEADWKVLEQYLVANGYSFKGSAYTSYGYNIAKSLASTTGWDPYETDPNNMNEYVGNDTLMNNKTGFNAIPFATRFLIGSNIGQYSGLGYSAFFWSSTEKYTTCGVTRGISSSSKEFNQGELTKTFGLSVRCVKDAQ